MEGYSTKLFFFQAKKSAQTTSVDISLLCKQIDIVQNQCKIEEIVQVWKDSFFHRNGPAYDNIHGIEIINQFKILSTSLAPRLVYFFINYYNEIESCFLVIKIFNVLFFIG